MKTRLSHALAIFAALLFFAPAIASAQTYDANQNTKIIQASAPVATYSLSGSCSTPLSPGTAAVAGGAAATGCVAAGSAVILPTGSGYAGYAFQVNTPNGGVFAVESSLDCSTYFSSNVEVAGGSPSALAYASSFSAAGKYTGAATSPCVALVATTAPTAATTIYGYLFQAPVGNVIRGAVPLSLSALPSIGLGFLSMPTATTNGAALTSGPTGDELTLPPGASVTYTIASTAPTAAPSLVRTVSNPTTATSYISDQINLASGALVYVTASSGGAFYRTI